MLTKVLLYLSNTLCDYNEKGFHMVRAWIRLNVCVVVLGEFFFLLFLACGECFLFCLNK